MVPKNPFGRTTDGRTTDVRLSIDMEETDPWQKVLFNNSLRGLQRYILFGACSWPLFSQRG